MKTNIKVREALAHEGMLQYQLAKLLGISEHTLCKKLRYELPEEEQEKLISVIANGACVRKRKANEDVRIALRAAGIKQWQLAEAMGINEFTMSHKLRKELPEKEKRRIIWIINNRAKYMRMIGLEEEK